MLRGEPRSPGEIRRDLGLVGRYFGIVLGCCGLRGSLRGEPLGLPRSINSGFGGFLGSLGGVLGLLACLLRLLRELGDCQVFLIAVAGDMLPDREELRDISRGSVKGQQRGCLDVGATLGIDLRGLDLLVGLPRYVLTIELVTRSW
ncbi:hypothetical protein ACVW0K_006850 [Streptomyces filamentosus]